MIFVSREHGTRCTFHAYARKPFNEKVAVEEEEEEHEAGCKRRMDRGCSARFKKDVLIIRKGRVSRGL